jgi:hypothetical protein
VVFSNITHCKWTELQYFTYTKPPNSFYLAPIGLTRVISRFSSKSFKYFPNPYDPTISPIFYPTQKCILEPLILPQRFYLLNQQDLIFSPIQSRDMIILKRLFILFCPLPTCGESAANRRPSYSIQKKFQGRLLLYEACRRFKQWRTQGSFWWRHEFCKLSFFFFLASSSFGAPNPPSKSHDGRVSLHTFDWECFDSYLRVFECFRTSSFRPGPIKLIKMPTMPPNMASPTTKKAYSNSLAFWASLRKLIKLQRLLAITKINQIATSAFTVGYYWATANHFNPT